jgi:hypothetical protein
VNNTHVKAGLGGLALWADGLLPTAHLLDATWWFNHRTVVAIRDRMARPHVEGRVALLGTPSLFIAGYREGSKTETWLFDKDNAISRFLPEELRSHFVAVDLMSVRPPNIQAQLVVADPPWYMPELEAFLASAQSVACLGASVEVCIPPVGIRPGIEREREQLFGRASEGGLPLVEILHGFVEYDVPLFERNTLLLAGARAGATARVGDLAVFRVDALTGLLPRSHSLKPKWLDVQLLNTRWRVAENNETANGSPELIGIGWPNDIFPSCSRRHVQRDLPSVWTSGNRAFWCRNPQYLLDILRSMEGKSLPEIASWMVERYSEESSPEARTAAQIMKVLDIEQREVEALRKWLNGKEQ